MKRTISFLDCIPALPTLLPSGPAQLKALDLQSQISSPLKYQVFNEKIQLFTFNDGMVNFFVLLTSSFGIYEQQIESKISLHP